MDWVWTHIEAISAAFGAISAAWAFLVKADRSIKKHLAEEFATKADINRIEKKVDKLVIYFLNDKDDKFKLM